MAEKNPFTLSFSRKPVEYIDRMEQTDTIVDTFTGLPVTDQIFIITGVRGSGKTVLMSGIANELEKRKDWFVERCFVTRDSVKEIAASLSRSVLKRFPISVSVPISQFGTVNTGSSEDDRTDIKKIEDALKTMDKHGQKLLITVDEVANTPQMQDLASVFQSLIGEELPVYFLGTAIQENIDSLKNVPFLTFLYRAPRIELEPLDMASIAHRYETVFEIPVTDAKKMARLTLGYSYAFQVLGYLYWNARPVPDLAALMGDYDRLLASNSYSKIWSELSVKQKEVCRGMAGCKSNAVQDVRDVLHMDSNDFNGFQNRLVHQGIVTKPGRGLVAFALPRFGKFIEKYSDLYDFEEEV